MIRRGAAWRRTLWISAGQRARFTFFALVTVAVLFPPVEWGTVATRTAIRKAYPDAESPPRYAFLFGPHEKWVYALSRRGRTLFAGVAHASLDAAQ